MLSIVIPYFNESQCIGPLLERIHQVLLSEAVDRYEILIIDNGSDFSQQRQLLALCDDPRERIVVLSRNFGYQGALWAGLDQAAGDPVIIMDGDGEDPPEVLSQFLSKWREGYQVVYGIRVKRKVGWSLHLCYKLFYRLMALWSDIKIPLDAGEFSLVSGEALVALRSFQDRTRLFRFLRAWVGYRQVGVRYDREKRISGKTKFKTGSAMALAWEGFVAGTDLPVRVSLYCAVLCMVLCGLGSIYYLFWYFYGQEKIPGFASLNITLLFLFSMVFGCVHVLAKYMMKILVETRQRPPYLIVRPFPEGASAQSMHLDQPNDSPYTTPET